MAFRWWSWSVNRRSRRIRSVNCFAIVNSVALKVKSTGTQRHYLAHARVGQVVDYDVYGSRMYRHPQLSKWKVVFVTDQTQLEQQLFFAFPAISSGKVGVRERPLLRRSERFLAANPLNPTVKPPNIATIMIKNLLWILVTIAGLSLTNPSKAALGWTWDECQQHWGKPLSSKTLPDGQSTANFAAHDLLIIVRLKDDKVVRVAYQDPNHGFSESQIETLQKANTISPTATWVFTRKDESTQNYE
jgi:hypothetical protein